MKLAKIGLDVPLANTFDFLIPPGLVVKPGCLVIVPFGSQRVVGIVVALSVESDVPVEKLRTIESVRIDVPALSADLMAVFQFCAAYYHAPFGQIALNAIPPIVRTTKSLPANQREPVRAVGITAAGRSAIETLPARASAQRNILQLLATGPRLESALRQQNARSSALLKRLQAAGWVESLDASAILPTLAAADQSTTISAPQLNDAQQAAVMAITKVLEAGADANRRSCWTASREVAKPRSILPRLRRF